MDRDRTGRVPGELAAKRGCRAAPVLGRLLCVIEEFVRDGFVRVPGAFPRDLAQACLAMLWPQIGASASDAATWTAPVVRLGYQSGGPFEEAANTPRLVAAYDSLVGAGRWLPRGELGTFVVRFPSDLEPGDDGWHVDSSFPPEPPEDPADPFAWRVNLASRGRALLMLFLFTDVDEDDAPTRIRVGSHREVARILAPYGDRGLAMLDLSQRAEAATARAPVALATGRAGDVYLCHPFVVHAAQADRGARPRVIAQPPLHPRGWVNGALDPVAGTSPVERAIRLALAADQ